MYHFTNHDLYHANPYQQQCPIYVEQQTKNSALPAQNIPYHNQFEAAALHNPIISQSEIRTNASSTQNFTVINDKKEKPLKTTSKVVDISNFSVEERLVAAVWVHERKLTKTSMFQIKQNFRLRFGREPPAKNTLLVWEKKLFSSGNIHDAQRTGRPVNRVHRVEEVSASLSGAPALSLRARARALRLPRTTLRTILTRDLSATHTMQPQPTPGKKASQKREVNRKLCVPEQSCTG